MKLKLVVLLLSTILVIPTTTAPVSSGNPLVPIEDSNNGTDSGTETFDSSQQEYVTVYVTPMSSSDLSTLQLGPRTTIRHDFGDTFSARLPLDVYKRLKRDPGVKVKKVETYTVGNTEFSTSESGPQRNGPVSSLSSLASRETPSDQTPYGIETMYNDASIGSTSGGNGIDVAVLDTGVMKSHPDLKNRVELCRNFTGGNAKSGCEDGHGHGTHVAGTVLADAGSDNKGVFGVAPEADLYAYKVCWDNGSCMGDAASAGIKDATDEGAEIISISFGGSNDSQVYEAVKYARKNGVLVISSSGNSGPDLQTMTYPAALERVVAVGGIGRTDGGPVEPDNYAVDDYSSRGKDANSFKQEEGYIEVSAPGTGVLSTSNDGGYTEETGTSMAAPHVSGFAAKIWGSVTDSNGDGQKDDDVRRYLRQRASDFDVTKGDHADQGYDPAAGIGTPVLKSIKDSNQGPTARFDYTPNQPKPIQKVKFNASKSSDSDGSVVKYQWDWDSDGIYDDTGKKTSHTFSNSGDYDVTLRVTDDDSATDRVKKTVTVEKPANIEYSNLSVSKTQVNVSEQVEVRAQVENTGGKKGSFNATLKIDGQTENYARGTLNPGESTRVSFNTSFEPAGEYDVTVKNLSPVTINVTENVYESLELSLNSTEAVIGERTQVELRIRNAGGGMAKNSPTVRIEEIPRNWKLTEYEDGSADFDVEELKWVWNKIPSGATRNVSVTFELPKNTGEGTFEIRASAYENEVPVDNESVEATVLRPSIKEVIAGKDRRIEFGELQDAIQYWSQNKSVPVANERVTFRDLQELIRIWSQKDKV